MKTIYFREKIKSVFYYDLEEGLVESDINQLALYLKDRRLKEIKQGNTIYLLDEESLKCKINLNCFACTKSTHYGCCCGSPCPLSVRNMNTFNRHELLIEESVKALDIEAYEKIKSLKGVLTFNGKVKTIDDHCALLINDKGTYKCLAHKYALENNISPYELTSLSCLMYPLEILELTDTNNQLYFLITSVVDREFAEKFGRWGSYDSLETDLKCLDITKHNNSFNKKDYKEVYKVNKSLLIHEFGEALYEELEKAMHV